MAVPIEESSLSKEMRVAAAAASMSDIGSTRKMLLMDSELPSLIPSKSLLVVRSIKFSHLKMGDIVCVLIGSDFTVRRFVRTKITKSHTLLLTVEEGADKKEALPHSCLLGKVDSVEFGGKSFDPTTNETFFKTFWGKLTEFGTHKAFGMFG